MKQLLGVSLFWCSVLITLPGQAQLRVQDELDAIKTTYANFDQVELLEEMRFYAGHEATEPFDAQLIEIRRKGRAMYTAVSGVETVVNGDLKVEVNHQEALIRLSNLKAAEVDALLAMDLSSFAQSSNRIDRLDLDDGLVRFSFHFPDGQFERIEVEYWPKTGLLHRQVFFSRFYQTHPGDSEKKQTRFELVMLAQEEVKHFERDWFSPEEFLKDPSAPVALQKTYANYYLVDARIKS